MKKTILAVALSFAFGSALSHVRAESTLYGSVDVRGLVTTEAGTMTKSITQDGNATDRFGLKGEEKLPNGWNLSYVLEGGFTTTSAVAAPTNIFGRRSIVKVCGPAGCAEAGLEYTPSYWDVDAKSAFGNGSEVGSTWLPKLGSTASNVRLPSSVAYFLPENNLGVYGMGMVAADDSTGTHHYAGARIGIVQGSLDVSFADGLTADVAGLYRVLNTGIKWSTSEVVVSALAVKTSYADVSNTSLFAGVVVPLGPWKLKGEVGTSWMHGGKTTGLHDGDNAQMSTLGVEYGLSLQTVLYADVGRVWNRHGSTQAFADGPTLAPGVDETAVDAGIRMKF